MRRLMPLQTRLMDRATGSLRGLHGEGIAFRGRKAPAYQQKSAPRAGPRRLSG